MDHSTTIKKLRVSKNITQKQLCKGICSRSTLAVFETKGSYLSADFLFNFLDRMNIRVDEYVLYLNINETSKTKALESLKTARINKDEQKLAHLADEFKSFYMESLDIFWLCYAFKAKEFAEQLTEEVFDYRCYKEKHQNAINIMTSYLMKVDSWGEFELSLFGNLMHYLSSTYIKMVLKRNLDRLDLSVFKNQVLLIKLFLNASIHFVEAELLEIVPTYLNQIDPYLSFEQLHWQILSRFLKDLCLELKHDKKNIEQYKYLEVYDTMGYSNYKKTLLNFRSRQFSGGKKFWYSE